MGRRAETTTEGQAPVGMLGDIEVDDAPPVVCEHHKDERDVQARGGDSEEIDGDAVPDVIGQERAPNLRRR